MSVGGPGLGLSREALYKARLWLTGFDHEMSDPLSYQCHHVISKSKREVMKMREGSGYPSIERKGHKQDMSAGNKGV